MSDTPQNLQDVKVKIEKKPDCQIEMEVTAPPSLVKEAKKKAIKSIAKEIELPGFRKGKAPPEVVLKKHPEEVSKRWQKAIADESFIAAQEKERVSVLSTNSPITFKMDSYSDEGAKMTFSFETEPELPSIDSSKFTLKEVKRRKIEKKELDEYMKQLQLMYAEWNEAEDRPIKEKDYIILDIESLEGEDKGQNIFSDTRFEVSKEAMAKWMKAAVLGKKKGDVIETVSKVDKEVSKDEQMPDKKVKITVKKIEEPKLLPLDDTFAKGLNFPSIKELTEYAEKMLNDKADQAKDTEERQQVNAFLLTYDANLPKSLVESELNHRKKQQLENPAFKAKFENASKEEKESIEKEMLHSSKEAVLLFYLSRKVCEDAKIPIKYEEVEQESRMIMYKAGIYDQKEISKEVQALSLSRLLLRKAQDYVLRGVKKLDPREGSEL